MINSPYHLPHISHNSSPEELDFKSNNNSTMVFFFVITPLFKNVYDNKIFLFSHN